MISDDLAGYGWAVEPRGPAQMLGDEYTVRVTQFDATGIGTEGVFDDEGASVITLVNQDGTWKVQQHTFDGS